MELAIFLLHHNPLRGFIVCLGVCDDDHFPLVELIRIPPVLDELLHDRVERGVQHPGDVPPLGDTNIAVFSSADCHVVGLAKISHSCFCLRCICNYGHWFHLCGISTASNGHNFFSTLLFKVSLLHVPPVARAVYFPSVQ